MPSGFCARASWAEAPPEEDGLAIQGGRKPPSPDGGLDPRTTARRLPTASWIHRRRLASSRRHSVSAGRRLVVSRRRSGSADDGSPSLDGALDPRTTARRLPTAFCSRKTMARHLSTAFCIRRRRLAVSRRRSVSARRRLVVARRRSVSSRRRFAVSRRRSVSTDDGSPSRAEKGPRMG
jgi:hypothetical protein